MEDIYEENRPVMVEKSNSMAADSGCDLLSAWTASLRFAGDGGVLGEAENSEWQDEEIEKATDSNAEEADVDPGSDSAEESAESCEEQTEEEEITKDEASEETAVSKATASDAQEKEAEEDDDEADAETKTIVSWTWKEKVGEETLIDGKLLLTNGTEESQPSFDDIVSMLPEKIRVDVEWESASGVSSQAESGDEDADEEIFLEGTVEDTQTITLDGWNCDEYEQDADGLWPMTGTFLFEAELPEGYELADEAGALTVEVVMEEPGIAVMDVNVGTWDKDKIIVKTYDETYDGKSHALFTGVWYDGTLVDSKSIAIWYREIGKKTYTRNMSYDPLSVTNFSDNKIEYEIMITSADATSETGGLELTGPYHSNIQQYNLRTKTDESISITKPLSYVYDGKDHTPVVARVIVDGMTLKEGTDYTLYWYKNNIVVDPPFKNAGIYVPGVVAKPGGNFTGELGRTNTTKWIIYKKEVSLIVKDNEKIYDGTTSLGNNFFVELNQSDILKDDLSEVTLNYDSGNPEYGSADVGNQTIKLNGYGLAGVKSENYTLHMVNNIPTITGTITPATITDIFVDGIDTLTYNGEDQTPTFSTHATTVNSSENPPKFYYSTDPDAAISSYSETVPTVKTAGDHTIYYVVKATNHKDSEKGSFTVHVDKADLGASTATITADVIPESVTYNKGQVQKPDLTVYLNDKKIDSENYTVQYIYENGENEEIVKEPVNAGTYKIQITGRGNCKGTRVLTNKFTINPLTMPALADMNIAIGYRTTGKLEYPITGLPADCGNVWNVDLTVDDSSSLFSQADVHAEIRDGRVVLVLDAKEHNVGQIHKTATVHLKDIHADNYINGSMDITITITDRSTQTQVPTAAMTFTQNSDGETFTAEIAKVARAEYSFDGTTWSAENRKTDCLPDTAYTGYIRFAETDEFNPGPAASVTKRTGKISAQAPVANPAGRTFQGSLSVTLTTATKNAKIFYTLDGTTPTESSSLYTGSITISDSVTLKAITVKTNLEPSPVLTEVYTKQASNNTNNSGGSTSGGSSSSGGGSSSDSGTSTSSTRVDAQKGLVSSTLGIITGENNKRGGDGYSHWMQDERGWWLCYSDGSYPQGTHSNPEQQANVNSGEAQYQWELVNGRWFAFDPEGYMATGWIINQGVWYYLEADGAMKTGWQKVGDTWYYLNADGSMRTDGIYLDGVYYRFDPDTGAWIAG